MSEIWHHGILGMKWGVRRYQNADGTLTALGKKRYTNPDGTMNTKGVKRFGAEAAEKHNADVAATKEFNDQVNAIKSNYESIKASGDKKRKEAFELDLVKKTYDQQYADNKSKDNAYAEAVMFDLVENSIFYGPKAEEYSNRCNDIARGKTTGGVPFSNADKQTKERMIREIDELTAKYAGFEVTKEFMKYFEKVQVFD